MDMIFPKSEYTKDFQTGTKKKLLHLIIKHTAHMKGYYISCTEKTPIYI